LIKVKLFPVYLKLYNLINDEKLRHLQSVIQGKDTQSVAQKNSIKVILDGYKPLIEEAKKTLKTDWEIAPAIDRVREKIHVLTHFFGHAHNELEKSFPEIDWKSKNSWCILIAWIISEEMDAAPDISFFDHLRLDNPLQEIFESMGIDGISSHHIAALVRTVRIVDPQHLTTASAWETFLSRQAVREFIQLNRHDEINYFNQERFEELIHWIFFFTLVQNATHTGKPISPSDIGSASAQRIAFQQIAIETQYRFDLFLEKLRSIFITKTGDHDA